MCFQVLSASDGECSPMTHLMCNALLDGVEALDGVDSGIFVEDGKKE